MKLAPRTWLLFALALGLWAPARAEAPPDLLRDARMAHDVANLDFTRAVGPAPENWAVLLLTPGRFDDNEIAQLTPVYVGEGRVLATPLPCTAEVIATLKGELPAGKWPSFCEILDPPSIRPPPFFEQYEILQTAGTFICRVGTRVPGFDRARIDATLLLPAAWGEKVRPAMGFWAEHRRILADAKANAGRLRPLISDTNPLVGVMASSALARAGALRVEDVPSDTAEMARAVIYFNLLHYTEEASYPKVANFFNAIIDSAKIPEELHGLALACRLDLEEEQGVKNHVEPPSVGLLLKLENRSNELSGKAEPDQYIRDACSIAASRRRLFKFRDRVTRERAATTRQ